MRAFFVEKMETKIIQTIKDRQSAAFNSLKEKRIFWDKAEQLFHNQLNDKLSAESGSQVFDPKLSTLTLERSYRVMAQLQTGKVIGKSQNDMGDAKLKNLILEKYVLPNANAQFDFLTKMRLVDLYSNIYGNFFTLVDWDVKQNGYVGPDVWLLNIRDVFHQVGAVSLEDSDFVIVRTWKPLSYYKGLAKQEGYKNVSKIVDKLSAKAGGKATRDSENASKREEFEYPEQSAAKKAGFYETWSMFERDRWVDYCVEADMEFRDVDNPHENGELPVDCKYSIPLLDDFHGMGDFERGGSMQMALNANWNLYFDAVKMSIFPPVAINKDQIASDASIVDEPGAKWLFRAGVNGSVGGAVMPVNLNPRGIETFNNTHRVVTASLLNLFGTTDTTTTSVTDPGMGKTPQALDQLQARENTRDNADRFFMEKYLSSLMKKMVNLVSLKQSSEITLRMFEPEIESLARSYPEIKEMYDADSGQLRISKPDKPLLYDYEIISGSTFAVDQKAQQEFLQMLLGLYQKSQGPQGNQFVADLEKSGFKFEFGELMKRIISQGGIQDWDKILIEMTEEEKGQAVLGGDAQKFQMALQQMAGGGVAGIPPQPQQPSPMGQPGGGMM